MEELKCGVTLKYN